MTMVKPLCKNMFVQPMTDGQNRRVGKPVRKQLLFLSVLQFVLEMTLTLTCRQRQAVLALRKPNTAMVKSIFAQHMKDGRQDTKTSWETSLETMTISLLTVIQYTIGPLSTVNSLAIYAFKPNIFLLVNLKMSATGIFFSFT